MNKTLSVLTPVSPETPLQYFQAAWKSVIQIELPEPWSLEWIIQIDGPAPESLKQAVRKCMQSEKVRVCCQENEQGLGAAVSRTAAFVRSRGELIISLDADDYFIQGGVEALVTAAENNSEARWFAGQARRVINGEEQPRPCPLPRGLIGPGDVQRSWEYHSHKMPIVATPVMFRAETLWQFGGWPALARSEDVSLVFAISGMYSGVLIEDEYYAYRKWPGQNTALAPNKELKKLVDKHKVRWAKAVQNRQ